MTEELLWKRVVEKERVDSVVAVAVESLVMEPEEVSDSVEVTDSVEAVDPVEASVEVGSSEVLVESEEAHSPTISGTESAPLPMATRLVPQSSLLASQTFSLSQS
jgi:hypothetical protein